MRIAHRYASGREDTVFGVKAVSLFITICLRPLAKRKLSLSDLPEDTEVLQCLRYNADDASCLNLNKVTTPTVLGINMKALSNSDFQIEQTIYGEDREVVFERVRERTNSVYPALVDATVLTWGIGMNLGRYALL